MESGWTLSTLKDHLEMVISLNQKIIITDLEASKEALQKALAASDRRLEGMNEFRGSLSDQSRLQMPRAEAEAIIKALAERITILEGNSIQGRSAKSGMTDGRANIVMIIGIVSTVIGLMLFVATMLRK